MTTPLRVAGWLCSVLVPLAALGLGLLYVKLMFGPVPLHFLVDPLRQALLSELNGVEIEIGDAALHRGPGGGIELRLKALDLAIAQGDSKVRASEAVVGLDMAALWSGRIAASHIVLIAPKCVVNQDDDLPSAAQATQPGASPPSPPDAAPSPDAERAVAAIARAPGAARRIDLARALVEAVSHVRRSGEAASHLRRLGVRDAVLEVVDRGRRATWSIPELEIDLEHYQKRSVIGGKGRLAAGGTPFAVGFRLEQSEKRRALRLETRVDGLRLPALAHNFPHLGVIAAIDAPVTARGTLELTSEGEIVGGRFDVDIARGSVLPEALGGLAVGVEGGTLALNYHGPEHRLELAPSVLRLDGGWVRLQGGLIPIAGASVSAPSGWQLDLQANEGALVGARDAPPVPIDRLAVRATLWPASGVSELNALSFKAGTAELDAHGTMAGGDQPSASLDGRIGPMNVEAVKALWPSGVSPELRDTVSRSLAKGQLTGGTFRIATGAVAGGAPRFTMTLEAEDLAIVAAAGLPPVLVPRALLTRVGDTLEISVPDAHLTAAANRKVAIKAAMIVVTGLDQPRPQAEISGRAQSSLAALVDLASRDGLGLLKAGQLPAGVDGKVEATVRATVPVADRVTLAETRLEAKVRITDGRVSNVIGPHDVTGGVFTIGATEQAVDIKGEMLVAGIPAKVGGQFIVGASERQSPIVITARLDGADRRQLGLSLDDMVQGEVPLEVQLTPAEGEAGKVQVGIDLTGAELMLERLSWRKPVGRPARLAFDVVRPRGGKTIELQGFRLAGDSIAVDGTVVLGADGQPQSYRFPGFSLNVVSNLEVEGVRRADKVWEVKARGKTFDGGDLMRSLYTVEIGNPTKSTGSMDLDAHIDNVIGVNDTSVKQVRLRMRRDGDAMTGLELTGTLDGGRPIEARMRAGQGRIVHVQTPDAGQALRTIGVYTSMIGGKGDLWINLDARGGTERSGQIQVSNFRILGDPIVSELVQGADDSRPAIAVGKDRPSRRVIREEIAFDTLRGSFASGNGQVAIESLNAAGPLIGASVRGKMDYRTRSLSLGGTYVPLSGLNRALSGIPLFGELLTGPRGDGIIGITFAVDGPMAKPNVIINPLSMVAPGVLREIFQMVPENPRVVPNEAVRAPGGTGARVRSSAPETYKGPKPVTGQPKILDGWSSQSSVPKGAP